MAAGAWGEVGEGAEAKLGPSASRRDFLLPHHHSSLTPTLIPAAWKPLN